MDNHSRDPPRKTAQLHVRAVLKQKWSAEVGYHLSTNMLHPPSTIRPKSIKA